MYSTIRSKQVKARPAPVRTTIVLFDGGRRHRVPDFGKGILRSVPAHRLPCTLADPDAVAGLFAAQSAMELDAAEDRYDEILEQRYLESAVLDRYTNGWTF